MVDTAKLVREFGTPLYLYDLRRVRESVASLRSALPTGTHIYYSLKANPHPDIAAAARAEGCDAGVTSPGEVADAAAAGFPLDECLYTGPGKSEEAVDRSVREGVRTFSVESETDFRRRARAAERTRQRLRCLIRVNGTEAAGGVGLRMSGGPSQFGVDFARVAGLAKSVQDHPGTTLRGLHFFPLTNAKDEESLLEEFTRTLRAAAALRAQGVPIDQLDIGGGFAAPFAVPGDPPVYRSLADRLTAALDEHMAGWRDGAPRISVESGRYLAASCGTLVLGVLDVKKSHGRTYAVLDGGVNCLGGMSATGRLLPLSAVPLEATERAEDKNEPVHLAGPLCTPVDVLGRGTRLPLPRVGDLVQIPNVGAYGMTASLLAFLSHPSAAEVVVDGGRLVSATRLQRERRPIGPPPSGAAPGPDQGRPAGPNPGRR
ncbi:alanine racemase [Thermobifida halotolerans]|uniref:Alanine racemase n=1 Tax=Thermobifida halotolerans TaxID=483545 RepID=A0AA97LZY3_9ACTN|nr:alanine racemase [Thermobifida halotolerans]UOE21337.1 alanine racemase [Thermobifida halotolerans]